LLVFYILLLLFFLAVAIQLAFGFFFSVQPVASFEEAIPEIPLGISIIICARNESENLTLFLPAILRQDYPDGFWEVVVVNDASGDDSDSVLAALKQEYPQLRVIDLPAEEDRRLPGKKYALDKGLDAAKFEIVLLTDADCYPASEQWLKTFAAAKLNSGKQIILGYGAYQALPGLLNKFIRWETVHTAMQYFSFARAKLKYCMAV
jgi:glycosyltransferase involved in cell wall biosynthesis